jgi:hypothetical protein
MLAAGGRKVFFLEKKNRKLLLLGVRAGAF